jgi:hypothetical protein
MAATSTKNARPAAESTRTTDKPRKTPPPTVDDFSALELKAEGNALLKKKDFAGAIAAYTRAIEADPTDATFFSNRSMARFLNEQPSEALEDANAAIELKPSWWKAHARKCSALCALDRFDEAVAACQTGIERSEDASGMKRLEERLAEVTSASRVSKTTAALQGQWYGARQDPAFGIMEQEFDFEGKRTLRITSAGKTVGAQYSLDGSQLVDGGIRMTVLIPGQPGVLPYIVKVDAQPSPGAGPSGPSASANGEARALLVCSPHTMDTINGGHALPERFAGPGLVRFVREEPPWKARIAAMTEDQRTVAFLTELRSRVPKPAPEGSTPQLRQQWSQAALMRLQMIFGQLRHRYGEKTANVAGTLCHDFPKHVGPAASDELRTLAGVVAGLVSALERPIVATESKSATEVAKTRARAAAKEKRDKRLKKKATAKANGETSVSASTSSTDSTRAAGAEVAGSKERVAADAASTGPMMDVNSPESSKEIRDPRTAAANAKRNRKKKERRRRAAAAAAEQQKKKTASKKASFLSSLTQDEFEILVGTSVALAAVTIAGLWFMRRSK